MTYMGLTGSVAFTQTARLNANNIVRCEISHPTSSQSRIEEYTYSYDNGWPLSRTQVTVDSYYLPAFREHRMVTDTIVTRYTYQN